MKILANDGIAPQGIVLLEAAGFTVDTNTIAQENLATAINEQGFSAVLVRSATTVRKEVIDACPGLRLIGRGGVGMDNIDVDYAREKGLHVINTPAASSQSVAELVMTHLFNISRFVYDSNRQMPGNGVGEFKSLKKKYAKGVELRGKTLGIIGFGRIGQSIAEYALGCGMKVISNNYGPDKNTITLNIHGAGPIHVDVPNSSLETVLAESDYISINVPKQADGKPLLGAAELAQTKQGVRIVNAARGGVIDEDALLASLESGHISYAALDVFENEPTPREDLLNHPNISLTPHIGAATVEAQGRIGEELATQIIELLK